MKIIGLTGGSGSGKSLAAAIFASYGIPSVNADRVYHGLLAEKGPCTEELAATFGADILNAEGLVDRGKLSALIFGKTETETLLHTLNRVTHKYIMAKTHELMRQLEEKGAKAVIFDAPQLFEAHAERECDVIIGVLAPRALRLSRIMSRDGISETDAARRIDAQKDDAFYRAHCDVILENTSDKNALEQQIQQFLKHFGV